MAHRLRVLLVEDDASLQRFVAMALEEDPVRLETVASVDDALRVLTAQSFDLIITDLMMPGRSGHELLSLLQQRPALRGSAVLAVFSAGLNPTVRQQLEALGVSRFLSKPCSLAELRQCVAAVGVVEHVEHVEPVGPAATAERATATDNAVLGDGIQQRAVAAYFNGNLPLFEAYRSRCLQQFPLDLREGDAACARSDAGALQRLAHSLKSVLLTLGHDEASDLASQLERDAGAHAGARSFDPQLARRWEQLAAALSQLH